MEVLNKVFSIQTLVVSALKVVQYFSKILESTSIMNAFSSSLAEIVKTSAIFRKFLRIIESFLILNRLGVVRKVSLAQLPLVSRLLFNICDHFLLIQGSEKNVKVATMFVSLLRNWLWIVDCGVQITVGCYQTAIIREKIQNLVFAM